MDEQAIQVMALLFGGWLVLMGLFGRRLPLYVALQSFMMLAAALFVLAAVGPRAGEYQVILVMALFAVQGLASAVAAYAAARRQ